MTRWWDIVTDVSAAVNCKKGFDLREHLPKNVFFWVLPEKRGEAPARIDIFRRFWRPKKRYKFPKMGGRGNSGNARKKTFFIQEVFPKIANTIEWHEKRLQNFDDDFFKEVFFDWDAS